MMIKLIYSNTINFDYKKVFYWIRWHSLFKEPIDRTIQVYLVYSTYANSIIEQLENSISM